MGNMGSFNANQLRRFQRKLNEIKPEDVSGFIDACAKELAARLLTTVIKRTLPGDYSKEVEVVAKRDSKNHKKGDKYTKRVNPSGKVGGTLRRGWTAKTHEEAAGGSGSADAKAYAESLTVNHVGDMVVIEIINPVEYASYVEYGHRTRNHTGWVPGKFMMTISVQEIQSIAPDVLENKVRRFLGGYMR
nr:MAG TPA: type I neck protein [Caudoviricetes sp.]